MHATCVHICIYVRVHAIAFGMPVVILHTISDIISSICIGKRLGRNICSVRAKGTCRVVQYTVPCVCNYT